MSSIEIISSDQARLRIERVETLPRGLPGAGDIAVSVEVSSSGFTGYVRTAWLDRRDLDRFIIELGSLAERYVGTASLKAMSPDDFSLVLDAINGRGHFSVQVRVTNRVYSVQGFACPHVLAVQSVIEAADLERLLEDCRAKWG